MTTVVSRADRLRDAIGVALLAGGATLYIFAYSGMKRLSGNTVVVSSLNFKNIREFNRYWAYSYYGIYLFVLGILVVVFSTWLHARRRRKKSP